MVVVPRRHVRDDEKAVACLRRVAELVLGLVSLSLPSSRTVHRGSAWRKKGGRPVALVTHGGDTLGSGTRRMDTTTANGSESVSERTVWCSTHEIHWVLVHMNLHSTQIQAVTAADGEAVDGEVEVEVVSVPVSL